MPNLNLSIHLNARHVLGNTLTGCYFGKVLNKQFHDLTDGKSIPPAAHEILGLSLKFIPTPEYTTHTNHAVQSFDRLERDVALKVWFAGEKSDLDETKLYLKSDWHPPLPPLEIDSRLSKFGSEMKKIIFRRRGKPNLNTFQRQLLKRLEANDNILYCNSDKGLGPVGVKLNWYIEHGLKHLTNSTNYEIVSEQQALSDVRELRRTIYEWTFKYRGCKIITDGQISYIRKKMDEAMEDPFGYFYLLIKLHKTPISTRPVCSDCASLPHALGQWVDETLQPIVKAQPTYFKNSFELKQDLDKMVLSPNLRYSLFTYDAVAMYVNIPTEECISMLKAFLCDPATYTRFKHYRASALIEAITIVMKNNRMRFGDIIVRQLSGIAMGMSPAPTIANLYVAIHEASNILKYLEDELRYLRYLRRYIDDGFGIWIHNPDPTVDQANWATFQAEVNSGSLDWEFTPLSQQVVFMDMTIKIVDGKIETSLYAKPMNLYLYIPPHSCHAPGVLSGLVFGNVLRIYQLCSRQKDIDKEIGLFMHRILDRGYNLQQITPLFAQAIENAKRYLSRSNEYRLYLKKKKASAAKRQVFYHLPYHPNNPTSATLQKLWRDHVFSPLAKTQLNHLANAGGHQVPIDRMIVCYSRAPNFGNQFSYRKICKRKGPKVSSYL